MSFALATAFVLDPEPDVGDDEPEPPVSTEVSPWLIEISCCRLFTPTNWLIYAFGSVGCVGSWF